MASAEDLTELKQRRDIVQTGGPQIVDYNTIHGQLCKLAGYVILPKPH